MIVALDGPAAAGKGTLARRIAGHFGVPHLDTGALYRAVASRSLRTGEAPETAAATFRIEDMDAPDLRSGAVGAHASKVAVIPAVRASLLEFQQKFARSPGGAVLDGRDIGTVIAPDADAKLFVRATPMIRAKRRHAELRMRGSTVSLDRVLADIRARDLRDSMRATAPMVPAADAALLDTSFLSIEASVQRAIAIVEARLQHKPVPIG